MIFKKKDRKYMLDENIRMGEEILSEYPNCINSTDIFKHGTDDKLIIKYCKENNYTIITRDVRMTILALVDEVPVLFVNGDYGIVALMNTKQEKKDLYRDLYEYFCEQIGLPK